jgi:rhamnose utilization protein RhaD (predicted bifunctional aldolase and dehydrogenase)
MEESNNIILSERSKKHLQQIAELSHRFGTSDYLHGGGGNTSVKNDTTIWIKPSGVALSSLKADSFLAMDRKILSEIYEFEPENQDADREDLVKDKMAAAVLSKTTARASVETPLHNSLDARFVVHTHPALVNGMTCSKNGSSACQKMFKDALWLDYIDPGYALCMEVRRQVQKYKADRGVEPEVIFIKNHGVFVAADKPEKICSIYENIMGSLRDHYGAKKVETELYIKSEPSKDQLKNAKNKIYQAMQNEKLCIASSGEFEMANGPVSPDHIVYAKSYALDDEPTPQTVQAFKEKHGYYPRVMVFDNAVFGIGETEKQAELVLEFAMDGALVKQLAQAFGEIEYMTDNQREFIENWEAESYRSNMIK